MIKVYESLNESHLFKEKKYEKSKEEISEKVSINTYEEYQSIDGFGGSFTDSAAYLMDKVLDEESRNELMTKLFSREEGIGLSVIRNPMGASDYARFIYSYNDQKERATDLELKEFSIDHDRESILPLTKQAMEINPDVKLFASPWSAPGWMKDSNKMVTGKLKKDYYGVYANYFVKFIESYQQEGVNVYAVTPQNEPLFVPENYPGMELLASEAIDFVSNYLKPAFEEKNIETKILGYDHNWDRVDYAFDLLDEGKGAFGGIAWHWYGGRPVSQSRVKQAYPDSEVHFSEGSGGEWIPAFEPAFSNVMRTGIEIMRNHSKSFILWNMALDENNGPTVPGFGKSTCRGIATVNQEDKNYELTLDYYALAHFSKCVEAGATRIHSTQEGNIKNVAFKNMDGSRVVVLFNDSENAHTVEISLDDSNECAIDIEPKSAVTLVIQ